MPIYEYRCNECGGKTEALQRLSEAPLLTCPACGKPALQKLVSAAGFQLKGSGWYVTDFRGGGGGSKKSDKADAPSTEATKSEAKPEAKSEGGPKAEPAAPAAAATSTTPSSTSSDS